MIYQRLYGILFHYSGHYRLAGQNMSGRYQCQKRNIAVLGTAGGRAGIVKYLSSRGYPDADIIKKKKKFASDIVPG